MNSNGQTRCVLAYFICPCFEIKQELRMKRDGAECHQAGFLEKWHLEWALNQWPDSQVNCEHPQACSRHFFPSSCDNTIPQSLFFFPKGSSFLDTMPLCFAYSCLNTNQENSELQQRLLSQAQLNFIQCLFIEHLLYAQSYSKQFGGSRQMRAYINNFKNFLKEYFIRFSIHLGGEKIDQWIARYKYRWMNKAVR